MTDRAPERWQYLPEEPTAEMINRVLSGTPRLGFTEAVRRIYALFLAAAPSPPALSGEAEEAEEAVKWLHGLRSQAEVHETAKAKLYQAASLIERQAREIAELKAKALELADAHEEWATASLYARSNYKWDSHADKAADRVHIAVEAIRALHEDQNDRDGGKT